MNRFHGFQAVITAPLVALLFWTSHAFAGDNGDPAASGRASSAAVSEAGGQTVVAIEDDAWRINGKPTHPGAAAEGLLLNVRMVNVVFEDASNQITEHMPSFDAEENTTHFINSLPDYVAHGVAAITIGLQGGVPGYEGAINSAFDADGSLRPQYLKRVQRVIEACDHQGVVVILSCFYQRQHSHERALSGRQGIFDAIANVARWIQEQKFTNVVLEVSNEYAHGGFNRWQDGEWLRSDAAQVELIRHAKQTAPGLLVSTSGMGGGGVSDAIGQAADFITIHFNNTSLENIPDRVKQARRFGKPVICNEDHKLADAAVAALRLSVQHGAGWGFMHIAKNQNAPFEFAGAADDPKVYAAMRELATGDAAGDESPTAASPTQRLAVITAPTDGEVLPHDQAVTIMVSFAESEANEVGRVLIYANDKLIGEIDQSPWRLRWSPAAGNYDLVAVVRDKTGNELQRSVAVDVEAR